jgi:hypothetical protein
MLNGVYIDVRDELMYFDEIYGGEGNNNPTYLVSGKCTKLERMDSLVGRARVRI